MSCGDCTGCNSGGVMYRTIAMCTWGACEECGLYTTEAGCTAPGDLELSTDGDSVMCESAIPREARS